MLSPSQSFTALALTSQPTELLLALIAAALLGRKTLVTRTARNLIIAEVLKFTLSLPSTHGRRRVDRT
jgi:hypothetical protein